MNGEDTALDLVELPRPVLLENVLDGSAQQG